MGLDDRQGGSDTYVAFTVDLVGTTEVAEMLGVSRQRVHQLMSSEGFPEPEMLSAGLIWRRADIEAWMRRTGRQSDEN